MKKNTMAITEWQTSDILDGIDGMMNLAAASGEDFASMSDNFVDALAALGMSAPIWLQMKSGYGSRPAWEDEDGCPMDNPNEELTGCAGCRWFKEGGQRPDT